MPQNIQLEPSSVNAKVAIISVGGKNYIYYKTWGGNFSLEKDIERKIKVKDGTLVLVSDEVTLKFRKD